MYTLHQLVANFREFFHLHPWCHHDCGRSLLSTIALLCIAFNSVCWKVTPDAHGWYGTPYSFSTLEECQALCISMNSTDCVAIDWDPSNVASCWILWSDSFGYTMEEGFISHYKLNRNCLGELQFCYAQKFCYIMRYFIAECGLVWFETCSFIVNVLVRVYMMKLH